MEDYVIRTLEVLRLLPDELSRLQESELRDKLLFGYDPITQTCTSFAPRIPRCLVSSEIQEAFHKPSLADFYHLRGSGVFAAAQESEKYSAISAAVKKELFQSSTVVYVHCETCGWSQTIWNDITVSVEQITHDDRCPGKPKNSAVQFIEGAAKRVFINSNVYAMHALDRIVETRRVQLNHTLTIFTDDKNTPKTRLEKIKSEASKSLDTI